MRPWKFPIKQGNYETKTTLLEKAEKLNENIHNWTAGKGGF